MLQTWVHVLPEELEGLLGQQQVGWGRQQAERAHLEQQQGDPLEEQRQEEEELADILVLVPISTGLLHQEVQTERLQIYGGEHSRAIRMKKVGDSANWQNILGIHIQKLTFFNF